MDLKDDQQKLVTAYEEKSGHLVYHVIHSYTNCGEVNAMFFISQQENEWEHAGKYLKAKMPYVYVKNISDEHGSEYGSIEIDPYEGLIRRIY